jgi:ADP-heptose:LPS heptosyltransferase
MIGDSLLSSIILETINDKLPEARLHFITSIANECTHFFHVPQASKKAFAVNEVLGQIRYIRSLKPDIVIDSTQWARLPAIVTLLSGAPVRIGFDTPGQHKASAYTHAVPHSASRHERDNFLALATPLFPDIRPSGTPTAARRTTCPKAHPLPEPAKTVLLHMFCTGSHARRREWLPESWRDLALGLIDAGHTVCFTGASLEAERIDDFIDTYLPASARTQGQARSLAGLPTLQELASILPDVAAAVSVNTGFMHLAALCGAPTVALNGPTRPERWGAVGPKVVNLRTTDPDGGFLNLGFESTPHPISNMASIKVDDVMNALRTLGVKV